MGKLHQIQENPIQSNTLTQCHVLARAQYVLTVENVVVICVWVVFWERLYTDRENRNPCYPQIQNARRCSICTSIIPPGPIPSIQALFLSPHSTSLIINYPPQSCSQAYKDLPTLCMSSCQAPPAPAIHSASLNRISSSWPTAKYSEVVDIINSSTHHIHAIGAKSLGGSFVRRHKRAS